MGCMYPGSIRTESIESIEHAYQDCSFQATNIDEHGNEVSRGELQITDDNLIYFKPSKFPTRWPIDCIRRYGCMHDGEKFVFEVGRKCSTGEAIYAFRLNQNAQELVLKLSEKIEKLSNSHRLQGSSSIYNEGGGQDQNNNHRGICRVRKQLRDASTITDHSTHQDSKEVSDPRPLSYAMIDFDTTKALNESAQAHAANRDR